MLLFLNQPHLSLFLHRELWPIQAEDCLLFRKGQVQVGSHVSEVEKEQVVALRRGQCPKAQLFLLCVCVCEPPLPLSLTGQFCRPTKSYDRPRSEGIVIIINLKLTLCGICYECFSILMKTQYVNVCALLLHFCVCTHCATQHRGLLVSCACKSWKWHSGLAMREDPTARSDSTRHWC